MNRITASIGARKKTRTNYLYQYDYGQKLILKGVELPEVYEVLFGNPGTPLKPALGGPEGVDIPDEFLTNGQSVLAYVFLHAGESDGETEYEIEIPVHPRQVRDDGEIDPVDQSIITQAIAVLNIATEKTAEFTQESKGYRDEAQGYAHEASVSEQNAEAFKNEAKRQADRAEELVNIATYIDFYIDANGHLIMEAN